MSYFSFLFIPLGCWFVSKRLTISLIFENNEKLKQVWNAGTRN